MALHIFYDSDITALADKLKDTLLKHKPASPFTFRKIAVPNGIMEKWLRTRVFAETPELTAGVEFPFMDRFLTEKLRDFLNAPGIELLPNNAYTYGIMQILTDKDKVKDAFKPFYKYIFGEEKPGDITNQETAKKVWQLSKRLADLLDTYEVHRPDLIEAWLGNETVSGECDASIVSAEKTLAQAVFGESGIYPENGQTLSLRQLYNRAKDSGNKNEKPGGNVLFFFGYSSLSPLHAEILYFLSKHYEIYYFFFDVCVEYWGDIKPGKKLAENSAENSTENALLSNWGIAGRATINLLMDLENASDEEFQCDVNGLDYHNLQKMGKKSVNEGETVLKKIQNSIRNRTSDVIKTQPDASLQIVGASGMRREVEMVHNAILASVNTDPDCKGNRPWSDCKFSDIAILIPDLPAYLPYIDYVFSSRGNVPYNIIDMTADQTSQYLSAFKALMNLHRKGITRDTLFNLLGFQLVANALDYSLDEVEKWREIAEKFGAFDYYDEKDMAAHGRANAVSFTWEWALKRLRRGAITDKYTVDDIELPLDNVSVKASELKFAEVVELLYRKLNANLGSNKRQNSLAWNAAFSDLMDTFLEPNDDDVLELSVRAQIFRVLNALDDLQMPDHSYDFELEAINMFVSALPCSRGNIFGGVTIGKLQPMRPIPYKQVYILGLGEGEFPGTVSNSTLDLQAVQVNDKVIAGTTAPDVNRYAFLENLMATGERLVLSYQEHDICEDAELFPSSIIRTLKDFADKNILETNLETIHLPLLERDIKCLNAKMAKGDSKAGLLNTFSQDAYAIAKQKYDNAHASEETPKVTPTAPESEDMTDYFQKADEIGTKALADFLKDPLRAVLQHSFGIARAQDRDKTLDPNSPLEMDNLVKWGIQREMIENEENVDVKKLIRKRQLEGAIPEGFLGDYTTKELVKFQEEKGETLERIREFYREFLKNAKENEIRGIVFGKPVHAFPPEKCLDFLLESLRTIASKVKNEATPTDYTIRCAAISIDKDPTIHIFTWLEVSVRFAREYLTKQAKRYWNFLKTADADGQFATIRYKDLAEVQKERAKIAESQLKNQKAPRIDIDSDETWLRLYQKAVESSEEKETPDYKQFVIENNIERYRTGPTNGKIIRETADELFDFPMMQAAMEEVSTSKQEEKKDNE